MCKVTRNARSALLSVRQAAQVHAPGTLKEPQPIGAKQQQQDEKLVILPTQTVKKHVHIEEMVVVKESESETTSCSSSASATAAQAQTHATESTSVGSASASLRAISALCLPEAPNVVTGALIRECLLGQVNLGSYALGNGQFLPVVVKEFNLTQVLNKTTKNGQGLHEDALSELQIHAYIQKKQVKNVIGLYAMHLNASSNKLFAYLEYAAKGELFSVLQARGNSAMPFAVASNFFVQLLHGIHALHSINVVHRDLSLENVLLTQDNEVKICDFGLATICAPGATINDGRAVGKVKYMCPELYYGEEYDPRLVDIWSAAVIFFLMLTGVFPYERPSAEDPRLVMLCHGQINELLAHWKRPALDQELLHLFSKMLCPPQQRWQAHQLLQLPFCQRFANVSKASIAAALDNEVSSASSYKNETMSTDSSVPSLCNSTGAHSTCSMDSPLSAPLDSGSEPASPNSLSQSPSHSYSQAHSEPTRPSSHFSASHPASVAPMAQCEPQPHPHPYSQKQFEGARQTAQEQQMQFYTPAPAFR